MGITTTTTINMVFIIIIIIFNLIKKLNYLIINL